MSTSEPGTSEESLLQSRVRAANITERDKELCTRLVLGREEELYGKNKIGRKEAWKEVAAEFNEQADDRRTTEQLKKCFENLRTSARKYTEELQQCKTYGGRKPKDPTPAVQLIVDRICSAGRFLLDYDSRDFDDLDIKPNFTVRLEENSNSEASQPENENSEVGPMSGTPFFAEGFQTVQPQVGGAVNPPQKRKPSQELLLEVQLKKARAEAEKVLVETNLLQQRIRQEKELHESQMELNRLQARYLKQKLNLLS